MKRIFVVAASAGFAASLLATPVSAEDCPHNYQNSGGPTLVPPVGPSETRVYGERTTSSSGYVGVEGSSGWIEAGGSTSGAYIGGDASEAPVDGRISVGPALQSACAAGVSIP